MKGGKSVLNSASQLKNKAKVKRENRATKWKSYIIDRNRGPKTFRQYSRSCARLCLIWQTFGSTLACHAAIGDGWNSWSCLRNYRSSNESNFWSWERKQMTVYVITKKHGKCWANPATLWWWLLAHCSVPCGKGWYIRDNQEKSSKCVFLDLKLKKKLHLWEFKSQLM